MAHTLKIKSIDTAYSQADNSHFIDVEVEVFDGEESIGTRRFGYPMGTPKEVILEDLGKVKALFDSEQESKIANAELEAKLADAAQMKEELTDVTI